VRNYAELLAEAIATGYYTGPLVQYVGDGFTVPWETGLAGSIPLGLTMWSYKAYLDARFYECSRLHDWLYTPYGGLIDATRLEADSALRECIAATSTVDAAIVYAAVRAGGAPFFGHSQTGFQGFVSAQSGPNMAKQHQSNRSVTMPTKVVILFQDVTTAGPPLPGIGYGGAAHIAGWSESYYDPSNDLNIVRGSCFGGGIINPAVCPARAALLPNSSTILGARFYAAGSGKGVSVGQQFPGSAGNTDLPQNALLLASNNPSAGSTRRWTLRAIPDDQFFGGEFAPTLAFQANLLSYLGAISNMYYPSRSNTGVIPIHDITPAGVITLNGPNTYLPGTIIKISGALDAAGIRRSGTYNVTLTGPGANSLTVAGWVFGVATGGSVLQSTRSFVQIATGGLTPLVERGLVRKVGRPSDLYRGRKSKHRHP